MPSELQENEAVDNYAGNETILLVEDNDMVREMTTELMKGLGYTLHVAASPDQALEMIRNLPERIDLLISDVVMPGMNGRQLFVKLKEERHEIEKVLYISGYNNIVSDITLEDGEHFLPKPFTPDAFMKKVRELLNTGLLAA
ncbi:MAG: hypothetical protein A2079_07525 [Geobacteraceae bacterium GWC2_48_7]|nr:MAG: hypothetical protein A2079_07525 [Geobacteraceae bacterium GWC2_48_7]